ncbi:hypothetical protein [Aureimonas leprariae]|uniref:hypothetical protein n=1 Tax=Plantimonas leprariae TaxID=2615207 RepID=UPI00138750F2|nr:hypothetical protein [Aureimonas leprariae]
MQEGAAAFGHGTPLEINPYAGSAERWLEWRQGWEEAAASADCPAQTQPKRPK